MHESSVEGVEGGKAGGNGLSAFGLHHPPSTGPGGEAGELLRCIHFAPCGCGLDDIPHCTW